MANTDVPLDAGSFSLTGLDAEAIPRDELQNGVFGLTGYSGNTFWYFEPSNGSFTLTGYTLALNPVPLDAGTFSISGQVLDVTESLSQLDGGSYSLSGFSASVFSEQIAIGSGSFSTDFNDLGIISPVQFDAGSFTFTPHNVKSLTPEDINVEVGSIKAAAIYRADTASASTILGFDTFNTSGLTGTSFFSSSTSALPDNTSEHIASPGAGTVVASHTFSAQTDLWAHQFQTREAPFRFDNTANALEFKNASGDVVVRIRATTSETFEIYTRSSGTLTLRATTSVVSAAARLDVHVDMDASVTVYWGKASIGSWSGDVTDGGSYPSITQVDHIQYNQSSGYFLESTGDSRDYEFAQLDVSGAGSNSGGSGAYTDVDETGNSFTDDWTSSYSDELFTVNVTNTPAGLSSGYDVSALYVVAGARAATGLGRLVPVVYSGVALGEGSVHALNTGDTPVSRLFTQDPATASTWTVSGIDAAEIGVLTARSAADLGAGAFAITGYSGNTSSYLEPSPGSFTLIGYEANTGTTDFVVLDAGIFALSGSAAALNLSSGFAVGPYALSGLDLAISTDNNTNVPLDAGTLSLTGLDANVVPDLTVGLDSGSLALTGLNFPVLTGEDIPLDVGAFTYAGNSADVVIGSALENGVFTVTGHDAVAAIGSVLLDTGSFILTGYSGNEFFYLEPSPGSFSISGLNGSIALSGPATVPLDASSFNLSGHDLGIGFGLGTIDGALNTLPEPDEIDYTASQPFTGTLFWVITASATPPALQGTPAGFAASGLASGSFAVISGSGSDTVDLSAVPFGDYYLHSVGYQTSDGAFTQIDTDPITIPIEIQSGTYALRGFNAVAGDQVTLNTGTLTLTGQDANVSLGLSTITLDAGSFTTIGYPTTEEFGLALASGSYLFTGYTVALAIDPGTLVGLNEGTFTISGNDIATGLSADLGLGTYLVNGFGVVFDFPVDLGTESFSLSGFEVSVTPTEPLEVGTYILNGLDATILERVDLGTESFALGGFGLSLGVGLGLEAGSFNLNGLDVDARYLFPVPFGSFAVSGFDLNTELFEILDIGTFNLSGLNSVVGTQVPLDLGGFNLTGHDANFDAELTIGLEAGAFSVAGLDMSADILVPFASGSIALQGYAADIARSLGLDSAAFTINGYDANVTTLPISRRRVEPCDTSANDGTPPGPRSGTVGQSIRAGTVGRGS